MRDETRTFHRHRARRLLLIGASIAACSPAAVAAQQVSDAAPSAPPVVSGEQVNDDIVVTAQKRAERLQDVPAAISVVSGNELSARGGVNLLAVKNLVPSLNIQNSATSIDSSVFLRGVGTINFSIAAEPSVGFVVDGVTYARTAEALGDLYDIAQIEVLRGPQGTLFGKNASAGVINIRTVKPGDRFGGYVEAGAATDRAFSARAAVDIPLSDSIRSRWTASWADYRGNIDNLTFARRVNGYLRYGLRGVVEADVTNRLKLTLIGDWRHQNSDCCALVVGTAPTGVLANALPGVAIDGASTRAIRQDVLTRTVDTSWGGSLQADLDLDSLGTLTSITAYRRYIYAGFNDGDSLDTVYATANGYGINQYGPQRSSTFTQELRLASPSGQQLEYVLGGFFYRAKQDRLYERDDTVCSATTLAPVAPGLAPCSAASSTLTYPSSTGRFGSVIKSAAAFANLTFHVGDHLRLIGGGRFTYDWVDGYNNRIPSPISGPGVLTAAANYRLSTTQGNVTGKAGVQYDVSRRVMAYATFSQGYKGPAFNIYFNQNANQLGRIEPEKANSYEVGTKMSSADGSFTLNGDVFYAQYRNFQANNFTLLNGVVITTLTNAGTVSTKGVELDAMLRPTRNFRVTAGVAYTDAQIDQFNVPAGSPAGTTTRRGEQLPLAPAWKGNVAATWTLPLDLPFRVAVGADVSLTSDQVSALQAPGLVRQALTIDGYAIANANIVLTDKSDRWSASIFVNNLLDKSYATIISAGGPGGSYLYQIPREADRYAGVTLRFNFGR